MQSLISVKLLVVIMSCAFMVEVIIVRERVTVFVIYSTLILLMETFNFILSLVSLWTSQDRIL